MIKKCPNTVRVEAPGRICLLGEHQDYLGLEVISGAMNLKVVLEAEPIRQKNTLKISLHQINQSRILTPSELSDLSPRDYLQSGLNVMLSHNYTFTTGWKISVSGDLPIGKGVSSSSALCVGWIKLLAAIADEPTDLDPTDVARLAHQSEVINFSEPGGMQDHIASAYGGLLYMNFSGDPDVTPQITRLEPLPEGFLLVDSGQPKETIGMISRIRSRVENQFEKLHAIHQGKLPDLTLQDIPREVEVGDSWKELHATLKNRDIVRFALQNWPNKDYQFPEFLPCLINEHHRQLSDGIGSSSEAIDQRIEWCLNNGALAGKVIGSGGGGCLLIYAPKMTGILANRLRDLGLRVWIIQIANGVTLI